MMKAKIKAFFIGDEDIQKIKQDNLEKTALNGVDLFRPF